MKYVFDIDNTLVKTVGSDYSNSSPIQSRISYVNKLYNEGHHITLYTARGTRTGIDYKEFTKKQMDSMGVKYHELLTGKMDYDYFVDDKAISISEFDAMVRNTSVKSNYKTGADSGYNYDDFKRFECLRGMEYGSILDVGSGPCMLLKWLKNNNIESDYEAMDIREEALSECDCKTHSEIPKRKKYDMVCLFGVSDYVDDKPDSEKYKKEEFYNLLKLALKRAREYVIFSLVKDIVKSNRLVRYSLDEIKEMAKESKLKIIEIDADSEPNVYNVKCKLS